MEDNYIEKIYINLNNCDKKIDSNDAKKNMYFSDLARYIANRVFEQTNIEDLIFAISNYEISKKIFDEITKDSIEKFNDEFGCDISLSYEDKMFICKEMIENYREKYSENEIFKLLCDDFELCNLDTYKSVGYVRSLTSNKATEVFAKTLGKISLSSKENYSTLIDDVKLGNIEYAVIPVENSSDGRLNSFRNLVDKAGLYTIMACNIINDKDEKTQYDLVSIKQKGFTQYSNPMIRFRITFDTLDDLSGLLQILNSTKTTLYRLFSLSIFETGRDNSFDVICNIKETDLLLLLCLLKLFYPQFVFCGVFEMKEDLI